jgi:hypothetical protein
LVHRSSGGVERFGVAGEVGDGGEQRAVDGGAVEGELDRGVVFLLGVQPQDQSGCPVPGTSQCPTSRVEMSLFLI